MSPAQYASHLGVSRQAVMAALATGRLSGASCDFDTERKRWTIDAARADAEWHANTRQRQNIGVNANGGANAPPPPANDLVLPPGGTLLGIGIEDIPRDEDGNPLPPMMVASIKTAVEARIKQLELDKLRRSLVPADEAAKTLANVGRLVRDAVLSVPARLAHQLAAQTDPVQVEIMLERALTDALLALCPKDPAT